MTFTDLLAALETMEADAPLIFVADGSKIGPGYHVTELRHSVSTGIDCGRNVETWDEARLQLLDGPGQTHMSVAKFRGIVGAALTKLPMLANVPFLVEFGSDNEGLMLMSLGAPQIHDAHVVLPLGHSRAICKPAQRSRSTGSCCGSASKSACC